MAIYKLGEICNIKRGSSPRPINKWLRDKGLMWAKISDISKFSIMQTKQFIAKEWITKGLIGQKNDLFITNSATPGIPFLQLSNNPIAYHDGFVSIKPNKNLVSNKYLLYRLILDKSKLIKLGNGAIFVNLSCKIIGDWKVNIPSLKTQKQIIDIIEPVENLFLKYSNCVRIDTFENTKKDLKALIDIIEPIENLIFNMKKIKVHLWNLIKKIEIKKTKQINIFSSIKTGNLNVNASSKNGKYPFFTCGKKILKTNSKSFKGRYILLSGNGELYSWWIDGEFDLYQRVYALKEKNNFFTTYYSLIKGIDKLRRRANGAVIKFIKINDIKSISLYESSHEKILETIFIAINKCEEIESKAYKILDFVVQILIK